MMNASPSTASFIVINARWLFAGLLLNFLSSFGQTFFIAMFGGEIRAEFGLSNGTFGTIYMFGNLASAATLVWLGQLADTVRVRVLGAATIAGLAFACLVMSQTWGVVSLLVAIYFLRLSGQGMMSHVATTAMARWFNRYRGRAVAFSVLGYPLGEAILPAIAVVLLAGVGWRQAWIVAAGTLFFVGLPVLYALLYQRRQAADISGNTEAVGQEAPANMRHWTRAEVLRHPLIWLLCPGLFAPSFLVTGIFFHQVYLTETKGWTLAFWASCYPFYAVMSVLAALITGWAIDRWTAQKCLPLMLLPLAAGCFVLASGTAPMVGFVAMLFFGMNAGSVTTVLGALWAELYGTRHLGSIKALGTAGMVFASALGPGVMGFLIDRGVTLERQLVVMAFYCLVCPGVFLMLRGMMANTQRPVALT